MLTALPDVLLSHIYTYCTRSEKLTHIQSLNKQLQQHILSSPRHFLDDYLCIKKHCLQALKASHSLRTALSGVNTLTIGDCYSDYDVSWFLPQSVSPSQSHPQSVAPSAPVTTSTSIDPTTIPGLLLFNHLIQIEITTKMSWPEKDTNPADVLFALFTKFPQSFHALTRMKVTEREYHKRISAPKKFAALICLQSLRVLSMVFRVCQEGLDAILSSTPQVTHLDLSNTKADDVFDNWIPPAPITHHNYHTLLLPDIEYTGSTALFSALTSSRTDSESQIELPSPLECLHIGHGLADLTCQGCWLTFCSNLRVLICDEKLVWFEDCITLCNTAAAAHCQLPNLMAFSGFCVYYNTNTGMTRQQIDDLSTALCRLLSVMPSLKYLRLIDPDVDGERRTGLGYRFPMKNYNPQPLNVSALMEKVNTLPLIHLRFLDSKRGARKIHSVTLPVKLTCFSHLQSFYMDWSDFENIGEWDRLFVSMPQLLRLTLSNVYAHLGMLLAIGKHCRQLLSLSLECLTSNDQVNYSSTSETLTQAASASTTTGNALFPHVEELKLSVNRYQHTDRAHESNLILVDHLLPLFIMHASTTRFLTVHGAYGHPIDAQQLLTSFPHLHYLQLDGRTCEKILANATDTGSNGSDSSGSSGSSSNNSSNSSSRNSQFWMSVWRPRKAPEFIPSVRYASRSVAEVREEIDSSYHGCYVLLRAPKQSCGERDTDVQAAKRSRLCQ